MRLLILSFTVLSGCATVPPAPVAGSPEPVPAVTPARSLASISYSTSPCMGGCPVYAVTVNADGSGLWEGQRYVAVTGERRFTATPDQLAAFANALAPHRPDGERRLVTGAECATVATDLDGVDVVWIDRAGRQDTLSAYYGCDMDANRQLFDDLRSAIRALPVADLLGGA